MVKQKRYKPEVIRDFSKEQIRIGGIQPTEVIPSRVAIKHRRRHKKKYGDKKIVLHRKDFDPTWEEDR